MDHFRHIEKYLWAVIDPNLNISQSQLMKSIYIETECHHIDADTFAHKFIARK